MPIKSAKMKISKNKKGSFIPKIRFLGQKVCSVVREHTDRHFPQPIIKDRPNKDP